jgi:hypothetical protein
MGLTGDSAGFCRAWEDIAVVFILKMDFPSRVRKILSDPLRTDLGTYRISRGEIGKQLVINVKDLTSPHDHAVL